MAAACPYCGNTNTWVMNGTSLKCRNCHKTSTLPSHVANATPTRGYYTTRDDACDALESIYDSACSSSSDSSSSD